MKKLIFLCAFFALALTSFGQQLPQHVYMSKVDEDNSSEWVLMRKSNGLVVRVHRDSIGVGSVSNLQTILENGSTASIPELSFNVEALTYNIGSPFVDGTQGSYIYGEDGAIIIGIQENDGESMYFGLERGTNFAGFSDYRDSGNRKGIQYNSDTYVEDDLDSLSLVPKQYVDNKVSETTFQKAIENGSTVNVPDSVLSINTTNFKFADDFSPAIFKVRSAGKLGVGSFADFSFSQNPAYDSGNALIYSGSGNLLVSNGGNAILSNGGQLNIVNGASATFDGSSGINLNAYGGSIQAKTGGTLDLSNSGLVRVDADSIHISSASGLIHIASDSLHIADSGTDNFIKLKNYGWVEIDDGSVELGEDAASKGVWIRGNSSFLELRENGGFSMAATNGSSTYGGMSIDPTTSRFQIISNPNSLTMSLDTSGGNFPRLVSGVMTWGALANNSTSITVSGSQLERAALTGDVTASANSNTTTIANSAVTNAKMANMTAGTIKGRRTSTGAPQDLTGAQVLEILELGKRVIIDLDSFTLPAMTAPPAQNSFAPIALLGICPVLDTAIIDWEITWKVGDINYKISSIGDLNTELRLLVSGGCIEISGQTTLTSAINIVKATNTPKLILHY